VLANSSPKPRVMASAPAQLQSSLVQNKPQMRTIEKPTYLVETVDNALPLLHAIIL
jgi:hypothetical protein